MADDVWGYRTLYLKIVDHKKHNDIELISYHYVENDSYQFINRGAERKIVIEFSPFVTTDLLKFIVGKLNLSQGLKTIFQKMINENKIQSGEYWDNSDK
jgi:hypothetical protein